MDAQNPILATVTICTRNRAESLRITLQSIISAAKNVTDPWELQIVDNGSTDATQSVIEEFKPSLPIYRTEAPVPGLSNARNIGIENARGQFIIWTDDDVIVDGNFLSAYFMAFKQYGSDTVFGGTAKPVYEDPKVSWFVAGERYLTNLLAIRDNQQWVKIEKNELPYGLNYAVRADIQRKYCYDPELGVAPGRRRGGEETAMLSAALENGETGRWVWAAKVYHRIFAERQTTAYVRQYYQAAGYDHPLYDLRQFKIKYKHVPVRLRFIMFWVALKGLIHLTKGSPKWLNSLIVFSQLEGMTIQIRDHYRK